MFCEAHLAPIVLPLISKVLFQKLDPHKGHNQARNYLLQNQHPALEHSQWQMFAQELALELLRLEPASMLWVKILVITRALGLMHYYLSCSLVLELFCRLVDSQAQAQQLLPKLSLRLAIQSELLVQVMVSTPLILISRILFQAHSELSSALVWETLFLMQVSAMPLSIAWELVL